MTLEDHIGHHSADGQTDKSYLMTQPSLDRASNPTGLGSGAYKDNVDYNVQRRVVDSAASMKSEAAPEHLRWFWALHFPSKPENLRTDNRVATLEAAKVEFEASCSSRCPPLFR